MDIRWFSDKNKKYVCVKDALGFIGSKTTPGRFTARISGENKPKFKIKTPGGVQELLFIAPESLLTILSQTPGPQAETLMRMVESEAGIKFERAVVEKPKSVLAELIGKAICVEGKEIRSAFMDGELWLSAADLCDALEILNVSRACSCLDDGDMRLHNTIHFPYSIATPLHNGVDAKRSAGNPNVILAFGYVPDIFGDTPLHRKISVTNNIS